MNLDTLDEVSCTDAGVCLDKPIRFGNINLDICDRNADYDEKIMDR